MKLPDNLIGLKYVNLTNGVMAVQSLDYSNYIFTSSNPNFKFDNKTGNISVTVPEGTRYMECDLYVTYKYGKLAFSTYDMTVTIPLVWTNLSTEELNEYYTASVRVGNDEDGYETVWTQRVLKNQEFDLPTTDELKELIGWNDYTYVMGTGYGNQQTAGLTIIEDEVYDFNIDRKTYSITVNGIQNADGTTTSKTYYADFGEMFNFDGLGDTGTANDSTGVFTKFSGLSVPTGIDPNKAIDSRMAAILANGANATAKYMDNSVTATFTFAGIDADKVTVKLRRGDIPTLTAIEKIAADNGVAIKDIYPAIGVMNGSATYQVICGELDTAPATIIFNENGGSDVADITKPYGSIIGALPTPEKNGYTFEGWYADEALTQLFTETKMPEGGATLYAKWTANKVTVSFHVNGGNELGTADASKTVTYGETYGTLPEPTRTGFGFAGWFTAATGGTKVTASTAVSNAQNHTLYAQWIEQKDIARNSFDFAAMESFTYEKGVTREPVYTFASGGETYKASEFTFKFMRQGSSEYETGLPVNAGTYDVVVSRPADNVYSKFEETYTAVLTINKAVRPAGDVELNFVDSGFTWIEFELSHGDGGIYDLNENATVIYNVIDNAKNVTFSSDGTEPVVRNIEHSNNAFAASVTVIDPNYEDWTSNIDTTNWYVKSAPTTSWADNADTSWYNSSKTEFTITTAAQLAGLAKLVKEGNKFAGKTIKIGNDIDLSNHKWTPIGHYRSRLQYAWFTGIFDGQGYTISGLYLNAANDITIGALGLFGGTAEGAVIKNVVVDDAFMAAGSVTYMGGIVGIADDTSIINCTSYAVLYSDNASGIAMGGILGGTKQLGKLVSVMNCVNYGRIRASKTYGDLGGIVGRADSEGTIIINSANFGSVLGGTNAGGIGGNLSRHNKNSVYSNNYSVGKIVGISGTQVGSIAGSLSNQSGSGVVENNHYLANSAANGYAIGGTSDDTPWHSSSFTSLSSKLKGTAGDYAGMTLIAALNEWAAENSDFEVSAWEATGPDGYPIPVGSYTSSLRK